MRCNLLIDLIDVLFLHICGRCSPLILRSNLGFFTFAHCDVSLADGLRFVLAVAKLRPLAPARVRLDFPEGERYPSMAELKEPIDFIHLA